MKEYLLKLTKVSIVCFIFSLILFIIAPIIDHFFSKLDKRKSKIKIFLEIVIQLLVVIIIWDILNYCMFKYTHMMLHFKDSKYAHQAIEIISGIILVGLQKHLINKIDYLSGEHFVRK